MAEETVEVVKDIVKAGAVTALAGLNFIVVVKVIQAVIALL